MTHFKKAIRLLVYSSLFIIIVVSCVPVKKQIYLQPPEDADSVSGFFNHPSFIYKLKSGDMLYIRISSADQDRLKLLSIEAGAYQQPSTIYLNSFTIDEDGKVFLPLIGTIDVADQTVKQVEAIILDEIEKYISVSSVLVNVKLVNFNITVLGEVNTPGHFSIFEDNINIFEALSLGGDLSPTADRSNVVLLREWESGTKMIHINLLDESILTSDYYYLMPGDILYIQPLKSKNLVFSSAPYSLFLSIISTIILILTFTKN